MYEYLMRTWKYFKRTDVLRLNARPPRGTNGEWYLGGSIGSIALLLIFKILYFARQIVPIEINPASWADSCCDNSRPSSTLYLHSRFHAKRSRARIRTLSCRPPSILPSFDPRQSPSPRSNRTTTANLILRSSNSFSIPTFPLSFHHSSPRVCSSCFTRYLPIFFHSLLTPSLSLSFSFPRLQFDSRRQICKIADIFPRVASKIVPPWSRPFVSSYPRIYPRRGGKISTSMRHPFIIVSSSSFSSSFSLEIDGWIDSRNRAAIIRVIIETVV